MHMKLHRWQSQKAVNITKGREFHSSQGSKGYFMKRDLLYSGNVFFSWNEIWKAKILEKRYETKGAIGRLRGFKVSPTPVSTLFEAVKTSIATIMHSVIIAEQNWFEGRGREILNVFYCWKYDWTAKYASSLITFSPGLSPLQVLVAASLRHQCVFSNRHTKS